MEYGIAAEESLPIDSGMSIPEGAQTNSFLLPKQDVSDQ